MVLEQVGLEQDVFAGQVAVVTGAGRGIGRAVARLFAGLGAKVVIAELYDTGLEAEQEIQAAGGAVLFVRADVSRVEDVENLAQCTRENFGPADILINNAIYCPAAPVLEMPVETWDRVIAVNLRGAFLTCKAFLPEMLQGSRGTIINMISTDAMPLLSAYIASKQGIAAFSQSLAAEVGGRGVRVIAFAPGFVDTPGLRSAAKELAPAFGISEEQFLKIPVHPAYADAAMPPEHAAAATAYLAAVLADEYHGEQVNGYTVLERAGFLQPGGTPAGNLPRQATLAETRATNATAVPARENLFEEVILLNERFRAMLGETEAEFQRLPVFVRPLARNGFKSKSGQSLQDWKVLADTIARLLRQIQAGQAQGSGENIMTGKLPAWRELFRKLAVYYREVPQETSRFVKDPVVLRQVEATCLGRVKLLEDFSAALEGTASL
jgi:NAD(P)-dependent dehydrogenase (short-subunit alcohol dehydrogenase family)